jgi:uncharacterized membrane protein
MPGYTILIILRKIHKIIHLSKVSNLADRYNKVMILTSPPRVPNKLPRKLSVRFRLLGSLLAGSLVSVVLPNSLKPATRFLIVWDTGMICFLIWTLLLMTRATSHTIRRYAQHEDAGRFLILSVITAAAFMSLFAIGFILHDKGTTSTFIILHVALSITTIVVSWLLVHTIFAFHYAHKYYQDHLTSIGEVAEGLDFPEDIEPDYWDFLYFSFVIGMTSQVSDVAVTSGTMRRLSLLHGILSFFFNTSIVAMAINIIAGLI